MDIFLAINNREQVLQLPIVPETYQIEFANNNEVFNTISLGDMNLIGNKGLRAISIDTFWPNHEYPYVKSDQLTGDEFVETIERWVSRRLPIRMIITNNSGAEVANIAMLIESFTHGYDRVGDVKYLLALREFKMVV